MLYHTKHESRFFFFIAVTVGLGASILMFGAWWSANAEMESLMPAFATNTAVSNPALARQKIPRQTVKGVYLTAYSAGNPAKVDSIIKLIEETELNAVVIDIKDYTGFVLYDSQVPLVKKLRTKKVLIKDIPALIAKLHEHNIYVIARQTVFQDPVLAMAEPGWAVTVDGGGLWRDNKGLAWVDATRPEVWQYNIAIAKEAIGLGFDEINFDYVRFPSDGNVRSMRFANLQGSKHETMAMFYKTLGDALKDEPAWISLDLFGLTMEAKGENDLNIGQRIVDTLGHADYIAPMMYPSHYPPGHMGFSNPADHPAAIFAQGMAAGEHWFASSTTEVRPWIQAFNMGAVYDGAKIRAQIDEIEKYSDAGFLMWNASNRYTSAGLKTE